MDKRALLDLADKFAPFILMGKRDISFNWQALNDKYSLQVDYGF